MLNLRLKLAMAAMLLLVVAPVGAQAIKPAQASVGRFIVQFEPGSQARQNHQVRQRLLDAQGLSVGVAIRQLRRLAVGADVIQTSRKLDSAAAQRLMQLIRRQPGVRSVEVDQRLQIAFEPDDEDYPQQFALHNPVVGIRAPAAWDLAKGSGVLVAVVDTGITSHPELDDNVWFGYDFISDATAAVDGDGRDSFPGDRGDYVPAGYCGAGSPQTFSSWHGTIMAGVIAAATNNREGIAGIAHNATLVPLRALGRCGGFSSDVSDAVYWAAGGAVAGVPANLYPVDVVNLSISGPGTCGSVLQQAIDFASAAGAVVVVPAGNNNANASGYQPGNCQNVITVGAIDIDGDRAAYSNYGPAVDIVAPSGREDGSYGVLSTTNDGSYSPAAAGVYTFHGTSIAAAHVAGVVALMQGVKTSTSAEVKAVLKQTARSIPQPCPEGCGAGLLDAAAAVTVVRPSMLSIGDEWIIEGQAGQSALTFTVKLSKPLPHDVTFDVATSLLGSANAGTDFEGVKLLGQVIPAGVLTKQFTVMVSGDLSPEPNELIPVRVSNVTGVAVERAGANGKIVNDDAIALVNGVEVTGISGLAGQQQPYYLEVPAGATSVTFTTTDGSAGSNADLVVSFGDSPTALAADCISANAGSVETCTFQPAQAGTYFVTVLATGNMDYVRLEGFFDIGGGRLLNIIDGQGAEGNLTDINMGSAYFRVTVSPVSNQPTGFTVTTSDGSGKSAVDYAARYSYPGSIPAGQNSTLVYVELRGDRVVEEHETFFLTLSNPVNATIGRGTATGRIINDDSAYLSIGDVTVVEGPQGTSTASFIVRLSDAMPNPVTFDITTVNGTAVSGVDYVARTQLDRFIDAGRTTMRFEVSIIGDADPEPNKAFTVKISNVKGAAVSDSVAVGTISNDDLVAPAVQASARGGGSSGNAPRTRALQRAQQE